jgi:hypothetical protein
MSRGSWVPDHIAMTVLMDIRCCGHAAVSCEICAASNYAAAKNTVVVHLKHSPSEMTMLSCGKKHYRLVSIAATVGKQQTHTTAKNNQYNVLRSFCQVSHGTHPSGGVVCAHGVQGHAREAGGVQSTMQGPRLHEQERL